MSLGLRILSALIAGFVLGAWCSGSTGAAAQVLAAIEPIGHLWLNALRMTVLPLVFALLVTGVGAVRGQASGAPVAARSMAWFVAALSASALAGALLTPFMLKVFPVDAAAASALRAGASHAASQVGSPPPLSEWVLGLITANPFEAAAKGDVLQIVMFALLFGLAAARVAPTYRESLLGFFQGVVEVMLVIVHWVLRVAPLGVFALAAALGRRGGFGAAGALGYYLALTCAASCFIVLVCYPLVRCLGGIAMTRFARAVLPSQILAFSTQSSLACLTAMIEAARDALRLPQQIFSVTLPMAVSLFRCTSPIVNLSVVLFVAHVTGTSIGLAPLLAGVCMAVVTNFAVVGLPSQITFFTTTVPISYAMGVPTDILPLLLAIEVIPDLFRTVGNVTADLAVTTIVAKGARVDR
ncbi:MAG: dicarboxylate/amino acid:cation symporter [Proteobacteria bacterium]|nr:dicarboxylate/amino acid:cation symporter [Pseudomonadota bacterium]